MFKTFAAATLLLLASSAAIAGQENHFYAGADLGRTRIDGLSGQGGSVGVLVGYHVLPNVAIEANYRYLANIVVRDGGLVGEADVDQTSLAVVGTLPLNEKFSLLGRLGYSRVTAESEQLIIHGIDDSNVVMGIGAAYAFTPALSLRLEFQKPSVNTQNLSLGLIYKF